MLNYKYWHIYFSGKAVITEYNALGPPVEAPITTASIFEEIVFL